MSRDDKAFATWIGAVLALSLAAIAAVLCAGGGDGCGQYRRDKTLLEQQIVTQRHQHQPTSHTEQVYYQLIATSTCSTDLQKAEARTWITP